MKKIILIKLLLATYILSGQNIIVLKGFVNNIGIDTIIIAKSHKDFRFNGIEIPVREGELFKHNLKYKYIEEYSIVYKSDLKKGVWRPINFFSKSKLIEFELYPMSQYSNNKIIGDSLGQQKIKYQKLFGNKFSKKGNEIYEKLFQLNKDSEEFEKVKARVDSLNREALAFQHNYFLEDDSILGLNEFVFLLKNANQMMISPKIFKEYQEFYLRKEFDHPLIERANNLYTVLSKIKIGQQYIDISLLDGNNSSYKLSDLKNKKEYTLLDLWSPWCGPCIRKSKLLKENYSKILSNTQVLGIVGGVNETKSAEKAINKYDYPWKNYLEISDKNKIWEKYGIENSGGAQFLINKEGEILAINPKLDELLKTVNGI